MNILSGWKEIAVYLRSSVRTVQRWERNEGLPVQRHKHSKRATVYAVPSQLDGWLRQRKLAITDRIRNQIGQQLTELRELAKRQQVLTKELQQVVTSSRRIWADYEQRKSKLPN